MTEVLRVVREARERLRRMRDVEKAAQREREQRIADDVNRQRQVGNFPQAFSHLTLIGAATAISAAESAGQTAS